MFSSIRKIIAATGLLALCVAPAVAGSFFISASGYVTGASGTAVVPSAGSCGQVCYTPNNGAGTVATTSGPFGYYILNGGPSEQYLIRQGPVAAGTYSCSVYQSGAYASVSISW